MTLFEMCINVIIKPKVFEMHVNQLSIIPSNVKNILLKVLCKRGYIKDAHVFKQLVNSTVIVMDLSECNVTDDVLSCLYVCKNLQKLDLSLRRRQTRCISSKGNKITYDSYSVALSASSIYTDCLTNEMNTFITAKTLSRQVMNSLFLYFPHLKVLALPHCKEVNDECIKTICENCKQLQELHIPDSLITDTALYYIGQNLFYLSVINILGTKVSDLGIEYLICGPLSEKLSEINIDKCPNVSSHSSAVIAEKCSNIKIFNCGSQGNDEKFASAINEIRSKAKQLFWYI